MILLLIRAWDYAAAGAEYLTEQLQEEDWSPGTGLSRCTPRVSQPANVRLMFFPLLTGCFYVPVTVGAAALSSVSYSIRTQTILVFSVYSWVIFLLPFALVSRDTG